MTLAKQQLADVALEAVLMWIVLFQQISDAGYRSGFRSF